MIKWIALALGLIILSILIRTKRRKYFWKDKKGNKLKFKEFMRRWKDGIEGITPVQQKFTQILGTWIVITGILAGMIVNVLIRMENVWFWVLTILIGSLIITVVQLIGNWQMYKRFKLIEKTQRELEK